MFKEAVNERVPQILRDYQEAAVSAVIADLDKGETPICSMATGGGKTSVIAEVLKRTVDPFSQRALVVAHTSEIIQQLYDRIDQQFGGSLDRFYGYMKPGIGIVMGDRDLPNARIVVATRQSLHPKRLEEVLRHGAFDTMCIDECFPVGTLIDEKPIETLRVGDTVTSYNEQTRRIEKATVTHLFTHPAGKQLCRIKVNGQTIVCTPNHPFLTKAGWKSAASLALNDVVLYATPLAAYEGKKRDSSNRNSVCKLRQTVYSNAQRLESQEANQGRESRFLLTKMRELISRFRQRYANGEYQSQICIGANEEKQSDAQPRQSRKGQDNTARDGLEASRAWWQRTFQRTADAAGVNIGLGDGGDRADQAWTRERLSNSLQTRHWESDIKDRHRSRWTISQLAESTRARSAQGQLSHWVGVESIEILESAGDRTFGGLCPDGVVYNLETSPTHTFLVNGIVVHNCHHAIGQDGGSYNEIIRRCERANPNLKRFGTTATPARADRAALESLWSTICYEWSIQTGIETGFLSPVTRLAIRTKIDLSRLKNSDGDYAQHGLASALGAQNWLDLCVKAYEDHLAGTGRRVLAFMPSVEMSIDFIAALKANGHSAAHIDGTTPKDVRARLLKEYTAGKIEVLSNFAVMSEGLDLPSTSAIFLGRPTRSRILLTQMVGRGLRQFPGKKDCLVIDMTVYDVKVLEVGTLLGKMFTCPECGIEYWAFLKTCPNCGAVHPPEEAPMGDGSGGISEATASEWYGKDLVAQVISLFENAVAAWHNAPDGTMSCAVAFDSSVYVIVPPDKDSYYRLYDVPKVDPPRFLERNEDVASLIRSADTRIEMLGGSMFGRTASWRKQPPSEAQTSLLAKLGIKPDRQISKGQAAEMISHFFAARHLRGALRLKAPEV